MAASTDPLVPTLLEWIETRLYLARSGSGAALRWPPTRTCLEHLGTGQLDLALDVPDNPHARFIVDGQLKPGSFHVLAARDEWMVREVIIKIVPALDAIRRVAVVREAQLTARLHHPNVIVVLDVDVAGLYMVLERMDSDLTDVVPDLDTELLLDVFCQAGRGLAAAHEQGVHHRDLRPENIFVRLGDSRFGSGQRVWAKVGDFGHARAAKTRPQATGQLPRWDLEDQYAFAKALWECLTRVGRPAEDGELMPGWLHAVLGRALMTDPSQRWADMTALVDAIERGRGATAATTPALQRTSESSPTLSSETRPSEVSRKVELMIALARDNCFFAAGQHWRELADQLADQQGELGRHGLALAAALYSAASHKSPDAQRRGLGLCLDVCLRAVSSFEHLRQLDAVGETRVLAVRTCQQWAKTYPPETSEHQHLVRLAEDLQSMKPRNKP